MNKELMDARNIERCLQRMAYEIIEKNSGTEKLALIGIQKRGVPLSRRIAEMIKKTEHTDVMIGELDITFYRDDLSLLASHPVLNGTKLGFPIDGAKLVLVDDVIYTGRTIRAAIEALFDIGRPERVQLCALIDRGHRELPFHPDYVGKTVPTSRKESVKVELKETDGIDSVILIKKD